MYTSLLLDIDNTLLDFNMAEAAAIRKVLAANSLPFDDSAVKTYSEINNTYWKRFERGEIPKSAIFAGRFETLLEVFGKDGDPQSLSVQYSGFLSEGFFKVDGAVSLLDYLKQKGYRLYAATNGFLSTQVKRIKGSGLEPYFERVFISEESGFQKPDKEYFDYICENIPEKDRSKILIIGDSQSSDILGALNAGIDSCWFNPKKEKGKYKSKYEIASLGELKNIL